MTEGERSYSANANANASPHAYEHGECKWCGMRDTWPGAGGWCQSIFIESQQKKNARARTATAERKRKRREASK